MIRLFTKAIKMDFYCALVTQYSPLGDLVILNKLHWNAISSLEKLGVVIFKSLFPPMKLIVSDLLPQYFLVLDSFLTPHLPSSCAVQEKASQTGIVRFHVNTK